MWRNQNPYTVGGNVKSADTMDSMEIAQNIKNGTTI